MKNYLLRLFVICLALLSVSPSITQAESKTSGNAIALNEAIANTLQGHPELVAYGYAVKIQDHLITQAKLPQRPALSVALENGFGAGKFSGTDRLETTISIAWLLNFNERKQRINIAQASYRQAVGENEIAQIDAAAETARRFLLCLADQNRLMAAEQALDLAEQTVTAVAARVNASRAPGAELARAKANLAIKQLELGDVQHELENSYTKLAAQWGDIKPAFGAVMGDLTTLPDPEPFAVLVERVRQNPQFARILSKQRVTQAQLNLAKTLSKPQWKVSTGVRRFEQEDDQALLVNFSLPLPLGNRNQGNIAAKHAQIEKLNSQSKAVEVRLSAQLFVIYQELQHSLHRATILEQTVIPLIEKASDDSRRAYQRGRYSYFEWQTAQSDLLQAKQELLAAMIDAHLRVIEIERITGVDFTRSVKL